MLNVRQILVSAIGLALHRGRPRRLRPAGPALPARPIRPRPDRATLPRPAAADDRPAAPAAPDGSGHAAADRRGQRNGAARSMNEVTPRTSPAIPTSRTATARCTSKASRSTRWRASTARRCSSIRSNGCSTRWRAYQRGFEGRDAHGLLRHEGQLLARRAARLRRGRLRLRHRLRRRTGARAGRRRRPGQGDLLGRRQDPRRNAPGAGGRHRLLQRRERGRDSTCSTRSRWQQGQRAPVSVRINPERRSEDASLHLHRPEGQQVRRRA